MNRNKKFMIAAAFCLGLGLGVGVLILGSCASPAFSDSGAKYSYLHFTAGECRENGKMGQGVIDLRNGNVYCVPLDGSNAIPEGTLNLDSIPSK